MKVRRITQNKEPITDVAQPIYMERGVKRREIIAAHKVIIELKKENKSYKHIIQKQEQQKEILKMLKEHNKKLLEKKTYVHSRRQYDIKQFKT